MNDDFKLNDKGELQTDIENVTKAINNTLVKGLENTIGSPTNSGVCKKLVPDATSNILSKDNRINDCGPVKVQTRWQSMGWKGQLIWRIMNTFFKSQVADMQRSVDSHNSLLEERALEICGEGASEGPEDNELESLHMMKMEYPNWAHPDPKSLLDVDFTVKLAQPLEYITVELDINNT